MNITLPNFHLLKASDLINIIVEQLRPDLTEAGITLHLNVPDQLFCEADQDQFVNSLLYLIELNKTCVSQMKENPCIGISAKIDQGFLDVAIQNNCLKLDSKAADAASSSTAVDLLFEFDSKVGNCLTLSFPSFATDGGSREIVTNTVERQGAEQEAVVELSR